MARNETYTDFRGREVSLASLDEDERKLVQTLKRRAAAASDWCDFGNFWTKTVGEFYDARGYPRTKTVKTVPYQIAQDLDSRIGLASGMMRLPDYRDEIAELIRSRFKTRREFCKATGLSEDMLSHVLAGRKHLAIETLMKALDRIGLEIQIVQKPVISQIQARKRAAS